MQKHGISEFLATLLDKKNIEIEDVEDFLDPKIRTHMPSPYNLQDMGMAVERIFKAINYKEKVVIYGDYDVDGACSSAILKRFLSYVGLDTEIYIPDRIKEGYGINFEALKTLKEHNKADLIISVDCGVTSFEPIAKAKNIGLEVVVIDHHISLEKLPEAIAIVNPNRIDDKSGLNYLCAAGVVFMLLVALNRKLAKEKFYEENSLVMPELFSYLDLVALATVCDVMSLKGLNRAFVAQGLKIMAQHKKPGIRAICELAMLDREVDVYTLGFIIGPRINAAGRIGDCSLGSKLLSTESEAEAMLIATQLDELNKQRQEEEKIILQEAEAKALELSEDSPIIFVSSDGWHPGIIGIVAGRLKEKFDKPAVVIGINDGIGKASARSVGAVDIGGAITNAKLEGLLVSGGGHKAAAGFTVEEGKISELNDFLSKLLGSAYQEYAADNDLYADIVLNRRSANLDIFEEMQQLSPFGIGNSEPKVIIEGVKIVAIEEYAGKHLGFYLANSSIVSTGKGLKCVCFNSKNTPIGDVIQQSENKDVSILGKLRKNIWKGNEKLEFFVDDIVAHG